MEGKTRRPVTVVTGFLGSGKTTLLARVLSAPSMANTAVLVNEFGEVGLDHHLLRRVDERTVLLGSGCVCCTTREDLVGALMELLDMDQRGEIPRLDRIVIETTGLADPAPILHTIYAHPVLQHHFSVDLVLTTVDAVNGTLHLDRNPESVKQVAAADKIVVTKTDIRGGFRRGGRPRALSPEWRGNARSAGGLYCGVRRSSRRGRHALRLGDVRRGHRLDGVRDLVQHAAECSG
jgi:G3E family GTPase